MSRLLPRATALVAALVLVLAIAAPAMAHAELVSSDPAAGARLEVPPPVVVATFSEGLDAGKSSLVLSGPDGEVGTGKPAKDGAKRMMLDNLALVPGKYTVKWTAAATDGHVERGKYSFTVLAPASIEPSPTEIATGAPATEAPTREPATPAPATEAPTAVASTAVATEPSAASAAPSPAVDEDQAPAAATSGMDVLIPIIAALALVGVIGVVVLRRSRSA